MKEPVSGATEQPLRLPKEERLIAALREKADELPDQHFQQRGLMHMAADQLAAHLRSAVAEGEVAHLKLEIDRARAERDYWKATAESVSATGRVNPPCYEIDGNCPDYDKCCHEGRCLRLYEVRSDRSNR